MKFTMEAKGCYPALKATMDPGEELVAEAGTLAWMDTSMSCETAARGGVLTGLKRSVFGGQSFFQNRYTAGSEGSRVVLATGQPGMIGRLKIAADREVYLQKGAYLASTPDVEIDPRYQGLTGWMNVGLFALRATGAGSLFFTAYGDIQRVTVDGDYVVDSGYAVAWEADLDYELTTSHRVRSFLFADQVMVRFRGQGKVWVQSRSPSVLASWVHPYRRVKQPRRKRD